MSQSLFLDKEKHFEQLMKLIKKNIRNDKTLSDEEMRDLDKQLNLVMRMKMLDVIDEPKLSTEEKLVDMLINQNVKLVAILDRISQKLATK